jgi:ABC-type transport system involved in multi-copper enzyme maturation permease subunit
MRPPSAPWFHWLRTTFSWSGTAAAWRERAAVLGLLAGGAALFRWGDALEGWQLLACWVLLALVAGVLLRRGWLFLFGPVLFYDLVRHSRRGRLILLRVAYLSLVLLFLWSAFESAARRGVIRSSEASALASRFFNAFLGVQFVVVVLVTPACAAGAITEERERRTLGYLFATDLRNHEIVLGKLASRLSLILLLILAGLPVLAAVQFLGGIDPGMVLAGFAATGVSAASIAALSVLASVLLRRTRDAIMLTYLVLFLYAVAVVLLTFAVTVNRWGSFPSTATWTSPVTLDDVLRVLSMGHPLIALQRLGSFRRPDLILLEVLSDYALFHGIVLAVCVTLAVWRLRKHGTDAERSTAALTEKAVPTSRPHRPVGRHPILWKELHTDQGLSGRGATYVLVGGLAVATLLLLPHDTWQETWEHFTFALNGWVRLLGTLLACVLFLQVGVRAAGVVRAEKDRDTLDSLLTTPLTSEEILWGKWLGSVASVRPLVFGLGLVWTLAVLGGGLSPLALPGLVIYVACCTAAMASIGLWFSVACRTTLRAITATLFTVLGLAFGHWLVWLCCAFNGPVHDGPGELLIRLQSGFTPPAALAALLPFRAADDLRHRWGPESAEGVFFSLVGAVLWGCIAWSVGLAANQRFAADSGRGPLGGFPRLGRGNTG